MKVLMRRNLGPTIIVALILMGGVAMFVYNLRAVKADTVVPIGNDTFSTDSGTQAELSFAAGDFGTGSLAFTITVSMVPNAYPDTVIHRNSAMTVGTSTPGTTTLSVQTLAMRSQSPVTVYFQDGHSESWNIATAPDPNNTSAGSLTLRADGSGEAEVDIPYMLNMSRVGGTPSTKTKTGLPPIDFGVCTFNGWTCVNGVLHLPPLNHQEIINNHKVKKFTPGG